MVVDMSATAAFALGFGTALFSLAAGVVVVYYFALRAGKRGVARDRAYVEALRSRRRPATVVEGDVAGACTLEYATRGDSGGALTSEKVALKFAQPMLFLLQFHSDDAAGTADAHRIGTVLLERCVCKLVKTPKPSLSASAPARPRYIWHEENFIIIYPKESGDALFALADGQGDVAYMKLKFALPHELERWYYRLVSGCGGQGPTNKLLHARREWGNSLKTLLRASETSATSFTHVDTVLNLLLGRLLFHWSTRPAFAEYIRRKINKKLMKIEKPDNLKGQIQVVDLVVGHALPIIRNPRVLDSSWLAGTTTDDAPTDVARKNPEGIVAFEVEIDYTGGEFNLTLELDFDVKVLDVKVPLPRVLARVQIVSFVGKLRVEFAPGSDYMWIAFPEEPHIDLSIVADTPELPFFASKLEIPELTELAVTFLKSEVLQLMVYPHMDDLFIPLIDEEEEEDPAHVLLESEAEEVLGAKAGALNTPPPAAPAPANNDDDADSQPASPDAKATPPPKPLAAAPKKTVKVNAANLFGAGTKKVKVNASSLFKAPAPGASEEVEEKAAAAAEVEQAEAAAAGEATAEKEAEDKRAAEAARLAEEEAVAKAAADTAAAAEKEAAEKRAAEAARLAEEEAAAAIAAEEKRAADAVAAKAAAEAEAARIAEEEAAAAAAAAEQEAARTAASTEAGEEAAEEAAKAETDEEEGTPAPAPEPVPAPAVHAQPQWGAAAAAQPQW